MADELLTLGASSGTDVANTVYEEHTVSGAIVTFPDGADAVPLKKCEITLPASLDGYSEVDVVHCGKNLLPMVNYDGGVYNPDIGRQLNLTVSETQFTKNGNVYSVNTSVSWKTHTVLFPIISGATYYEKWTLSVESGQQGSTRAYLDEDFKVLARYNSNSSDPIVTNGVMTPPTGTKYLAITWTNRGTAVQTLNITEPMIEIGSSASAWEEYNGTTHTATLGRTIYGGSVDVVKGQGSGEWATVKLKDLTWYYSTSYGGFFHSPSIQSVVSDETYICVPSEYTNVRLNSYQLQNTDDAIGINADNGSAVTGGAPLKSIVVKDTDFSTVADLIAHFTENDSELCYKQATPETFTFDPVPIDSKLGNNTLWAEQGTNVEVTYYSEREVINDYHVTSTQLTAIADAIREKKQSTAPILFEDFPNEILTIETGGGGEDAVTWVFTATGTSSDNYYYTAQEDGLYLAVAVRNQNTGCSISLPDGGDTILTSTLLSPRFQMKVVRLTAGQRINLYIYNSSHVRGGWIFKLNVTPTAIAYSRAVDQYGSYNIVNQGTSNTVLSIIATVWGNSYGNWDPTMKIFTLSPINSSANLRIMYGIDMVMPAIPYGGPSTCQWILSIQED